MIVDKSIKVNKSYHIEYYPNTRSHFLIHNKCDWAVGHIYGGRLIGNDGCTCDIKPSKNTLNKFKFILGVS